MNVALAVFLITNVHLWLSDPAKDLCEKPTPKLTKDRVEECRKVKRSYTK